MSGPIIRKYGFPNFEKIFGERKPEHGVDEKPAEEPKPVEEPGAGDEPTKGEAEKK